MDVYNKDKSFAADDLVGKALGNKWNIIHKITQEGTGGTFSICYIAEYNNKEYFLKAIDFKSAFNKPNFINAMTDKMNDFRYERDLSAYCRDKNVKNVTVIVDSGEEVISGYTIGNVAYLVFDKADCDVRKFLNISNATDIAWCFKSLKDITIALRDLHNIGVSHQDLKPSNILVFSRQSKISDLGRSMCDSIRSQYNQMIYSGDYSYAPAEAMYGYEWTKDWHLKNYMTDCYLLGNLTTFYLTGGATINALMSHFMPEKLSPLHYRGAFDAIRTYLVNAFEKVLACIKESIPDIVDKQKAMMVISSLCYPMPEKRGHPKVLNSIESNYNLERYISTFELLGKKVEFELYKLSIKK